MPASPAKTFFETALLGMLASGFFAVLGSGQLDSPTIAIMFLAMAFRGFLIAGLVPAPVPTRTVNNASLLYIAFLPLDAVYISHGVIPAMVHLLFFVAVVKIASARTQRDFAYLKIIAGTELLAAALLSAHLSFFIFLTTFVMCGIAAFASGEVARASASTPVTRVSRSAIRGFSPRLITLSSALFCAILVMTTGIFFVLPRTARAAFQRLGFQPQHLPGFANEVSLSEIGELKQNNAPVMHIRAYGSQPLPTRWRGSSLTSFDGKRWFNPPAPEERLRVDQGQIVLAPVSPAQLGQSISYEVDLSDIAPDVLFFAGTPETISIRVPALFRTHSGTLRAPRFGGTGMHYGAFSRVDDEEAPASGFAPPLDPEDRSALLQLPPLDSRIRQLAHTWTDAAVSQNAKATAIVDHLHHEFGYSLKLPEVEEADPLADFLFNRREGHCEYFAASMAVMLRTLGIPSRVATGFYGGVFNPISGWQVMRAADAHSWVEAWIPGRGWTTFDPTPPDPNPGSEPDLLSRASLWFDAADQFWRGWVVGYDLDHQVFLVSRAETASRSMRVPTEWLASISWTDWYRPEGWKGWPLAAAVALMLVIAIGKYGRQWRDAWVRRSKWRRVQRGEANPSDATVVYQRMLATLERRGYAKPAWFTPGEFAAGLPASELARFVKDLTEAYQQARFGGRADAAPRMLRALEQIEALPA